MKANKATLIAQTIGMYLMHIPLYIFFIVELFPGEHQSIAKGLLLALLILTVPVVLICVANIVFAVISIFKGETDPSKTVLKVKLALIPWYVINFVMCVVIVAVLSNPFMMLGIPAVIGLSLCMTYFFMLGTSLADVANYLRKVYVEKSEKPSKSRIVTVICLFIFCLDIVGGVAFYRQNERAKFASNSDPAISEEE